MWPPVFIEEVDAVLDAYQHEVGRQSPSDDGAIWNAVERAVRALNAVDLEHARIETGEREELAEYFGAVLTAAGVDLGTLTARRGLHPLELTDPWRDW
ncbi:hypothetical protein SAMN05443668_101888 [Cryptosporangium aurantiacum]|uniref:MazG nucleotide pyrophosphohydrolase domain-containing protein n=1 Tax=Cryptosporangium aurantiacum TaxID=134849 RepID=A0A1M7JS55_9ACTN|nr:hypothetical protein [Cryptosporangium aurantiacum]SHM55751.1 hypothetical protein SAMN05443668_101888 [Cryptosporangium aurantiacum]